MSRLEPESGIWYAVCWLMLLSRLVSRRLHLGTWKHLKLDDYLICLAMVRIVPIFTVAQANEATRLQ
jgi:hypothetical protein